MTNARQSSIRLLCGLAAALWMLWGAGCSSDAVQVRLFASGSRPPGGDPRRIEIRAQVTGSQAGLRYKWFSVAGECDPQESEWPATFFKFGQGTTSDRVSVEVWRGEQRLAESELDVKLGGEPADLFTEPLSTIEVVITDVPAYEPYGGPETRAEISGKVSGEIMPEFKIVLYARASGTWYIQPTVSATHPIRPDNTFASWTHTGSNYAALVVQPGYDPPARLDVLPQVGEYVLARTIVDGKVQ